MGFYVVSCYFTIGLLLISSVLGIQYADASITDLSFDDKSLKDKRLEEPKKCGLENVNFQVHNLEVESICSTPYKIEVDFKHHIHDGIITVDVPKGFLEPGTGSCNTSFPFNVIVWRYPATKQGFSDMKFDPVVTKDKHSIEVMVTSDIESIKITTSYVPPQPTILDSCLHDTLNHIRRSSNSTINYNNFEDMANQHGQYGWIPWLSGMTDMGAISHPTCQDCGFIKSISYIPEWYFLETARWWTLQNISDREFVQGVEYLMKENIIQYDNEIDFHRDNMMIKILDFKEI